MTLIIASAVILIAITTAFILYPIFRASALGRQYITDSVTGDQLADLLAQRDAVYEAIRDADFDLEIGKLTTEDHRLMRERLTAEGVRLLQELDRLMESEVREDLEQEIEREVAVLRGIRPAEAIGDAETERSARRAAAVTAASAGSDGKLVTCPSCGQRVRAGAQFCTSCGASLTLTCPECDVTVELDDRFCSKCGVGLSQAQEQVKEVQNT